MSVSSAAEINSLLAIPIPDPIPARAFGSCWSWKDVVLIPSEMLTGAGIVYSGVMGQWWYLGGCALVELGLLIGHYQSYRQFADQRQISADLHTSSVNLQITAAKTLTSLKALQGINGELGQDLGSEKELLATQAKSLQTFAQQNQTLKTEKEGLTTQIQLLKNTVEQTIPYLNELKQANTEIQNTFKQANKDEVNLEQINTHLSQTISTSEKKEQELTQALAHADSIEETTLRAINDQSMRSVQELEQIQHVIAEVKQLEADLQAKKEDVQNVTSQLSQLQQRVKEELETLDKTKKEREEVRISIHNETEALNLATAKFQKYYQSFETTAEKTLENKKAGDNNI